MPEGWTLMQHGLVKGALLLLGVSHHHDGDDIVATCGWESMVNALGYTVRNGNLHQNVDLEILGRTAHHRSTELQHRPRMKSSTFERVEEATCDRSHRC